MDSLRRKPNFEFWIACFTKVGGRQAQRSTKTRDRRLVLRLSNEFETEARTHRTAAHARRVITDIHKGGTGCDLGFVTTRDDSLSGLLPRRGPLPSQPGTPTGRSSLNS